jgi:deazaflavin-dependent oxidoreductase (nitroreductase family)
MLLKLLLTPRGRAFDRFMVRWTTMSPLSILFARENNYPFPPRPLLLMATGRKTGRKRGAVLPYFEIDGCFFVVGSMGGAATEPQWVGNLRVDPNATIRVRGRPRRVKARIAGGDERKRLWDKLVERVPTYAQFQSLTTREIPLVILE